MNRLPVNYQVESDRTQRIEALEMFHLMRVSGGMQSLQSFPKEIKGSKRKETSVGIYSI